ncbi:hypothetical protein, partial [Escherichia coli]|uniref:hypothetical protein n=1 Tax=Escherichia coli TaxID=562 RepID=UPI001BC83B75
TITYLSDIGCLEIQGASLDSKNDVLYFVNRYFLLCIYYEIIKNNTLWVVETGYKSQAGVVRMFLPPQYQTAIVS